MSITGPNGVTLDFQGNLYGVDCSSSTNKITKWSSPLIAQATGSTFVASTGNNYVLTVRMDTFGNMYIAGNLQEVLYKVDSTGLVMTIVAGSLNLQGFSGDGGPATSATFYGVADVAISALYGDLYIADGNNNRIRKVDGRTQIISTYAGSGLTAGVDNVAATSSGINFPSAVALDANDNLYIADLSNYAIRCVNKATGIITTIAGRLASSGATGDGGPATSATLATPWGITYDPQGMLWITGGGSSGTVRMVDLTSKGNIITTIASGTSRSSDSSSLMKMMQVNHNDILFYFPLAMTGLHDPRQSSIDPTSGNLYVAQNTGVNGIAQVILVRKKTWTPLTSHPLLTHTPTQFPTGQPTTQPHTLSPTIAIKYMITTIAGSAALGAGSSGDGGPASGAQLYNPTVVVVDSNSGITYIADQYNHKIRMVNSAGIITTFAGTGTIGNSGDGDLATLAQLNGPGDVYVDASGNVYIVDISNFNIRMVNSAGIISTISGTGGGGITADGAVAYGAQLKDPFSVAVDSNGNVYIAEKVNHKVRMINSAGILSTYAGTGTGGYNGDGGPATSAQLYFPVSIRFDTSSNLYIADYSNCRIRMVSVAGIISTIAGTTTCGVSGDGGPATSATLYYPSGVGVDVYGNVFVVSSNAGTARLISVTTGIITTIAGSSNGHLGDYGPATIAQLYQPNCIFPDVSGNIYIADSGNNEIRFLTSNVFKPSPLPSSQPSNQPSMQPSRQPSIRPSRQPSQQPTNQPSLVPSIQPSGSLLLTSTIT